MDLASMMRTLTDQGPTYWVAAAAVALGATLLITAAVLQWRRLRAAAPRRRRPAVKPAVHPAALATYATRAAPAAPAAAKATDPALVGRLTDAADRLAAIRADLTRWEHLPDGSDLKATASHVEYVFRSGEA